MMSKALSPCSQRTHLFLYFSAIAALISINFAGKIARCRFLDFVVMFLHFR